MPYDDNVQQFQLGYLVSERIGKITELLDDISELDVVEDHAADEYIEDAQSHLRAAKTDVRLGEKREEEGEESYEDTPEHPRPGSVNWAMRTLETNSGQSYVTAEFAQKIVTAVLGFALNHDEFDVSWDVDEIHMGAAVAEIVEPAGEARGIATVKDYEPICTYADVSGLLVESLGGEPSDFVAGGHGFTADGRHDENVDALKELLDH